MLGFVKSDDHSKNKKKQQKTQKKTCIFVP